MANNINDTETFYPANAQEWRQWLQENHDKKQNVWLVYYKKKSGIPTINHSEAVDEALCYGWIDSVRRSAGGDSFIQFFGKRKAVSTWSKVNKAKIDRLIADGLMMPAGYESIETAKQNGSWTILDEVEELVIPPGLEDAFSARQGAKDFFLSLSKSVQKNILQHIALAKREETRQKRIVKIAELMAKKQKPGQL